MFGAETISSFQRAAEALTRTADGVDARTAELASRANSALDALPELELIRGEVADAVSDAKTAAQLVSIAALCIVGVSILALGVATIALLRVEN